MNGKTGRQAREKPLSENLQFNVKILLFLFFFASFSDFSFVLLLDQCFFRWIFLNLIFKLLLLLLLLLPMQGKLCIRSFSFPAKKLFFVAMLEFNKGHSNANTTFALALALTLLLSMISNIHIHTYIALIFD